ncbi:hypothetical protein KHA80_06865 [Anaerobacillus sp. HL2]|nr:hypothetical protein KHA80_06865 [Anaerobacillus sp. HL2]
MLAHFKNKDEIYYISCSFSKNETIETVLKQIVEEAATAIQNGAALLI